MKNVRGNKIVMMLTLTVLGAQSVGIFAMNEDTPAPSFASRVRQTGRQVRQRAGDAIDGVIVSAHNLANDLQQYKQCRGTQEGCPPALMQRIKKAGAVISVGAGAVLIAGTAAVAGIGGKYLHEKKRSAEYENAIKTGKYRDVLPIIIKKFGFNRSNQANNALVFAAFKGDASDMGSHVQFADEPAIRAAIEVATIRYPEKTGVSGYLTNEYKRKFNK